MRRETRDNRALAAKNVNSEMEKPIDFWLRKGKAVGETKPTERPEGRAEVTTQNDIRKRKGLKFDIKKDIKLYIIYKYII